VSDSEGVRKGRRDSKRRIIERKVTYDFNHLFKYLLTHLEPYLLHSGTVTVIVINILQLTYYTQVQSQSSSSTYCYSPGAFHPVCM